MRLTERRPLWRRARLDLIGIVLLAVGTLAALRAHAFEGAAGSVYFGRAVELNLALLVLPVAVWITGSLLAARAFGTVLAIFFLGEAFAGFHAAGIAIILAGVLLATGSPPSVASKTP